MRIAVHRQAGLAALMVVLGSAVPAAAQRAGSRDPCSAATESYAVVTGRHHPKSDIVAAMPQTPCPTLPSAAYPLDVQLDIGADRAPRHSGEPRPR